MGPPSPPRTRPTSTRTCDQPSERGRLMRLPRLPHRSLVIVSLAALSLVTAGGALALRPAGTRITPPSGHVAPKLVADTDAPCNATPRKGYARCFAVVRTPAPGQIEPSDAGPPA